MYFIHLVTIGKDTIKYKLLKLDIKNNLTNILSKFVQYQIYFRIVLQRITSINLSIKIK